MSLSFKDRNDPSKNKIRVHVCGLTGHGKSSFAEEYCKQAGLKPIVLDVDDTNYTSVPNPDVSFTGDSKKVFDKIENTLKEIIKLPNSECDTIIFDGWDSCMEKITPKPKSHNPYWHFGIRKQRCDAIMLLLLDSGKHIIFIGQLDSKISDDPENKPSAPVKVMNNCVNVSYFCYVTEKGEFCYDIVKNRFGKQLKGLNVKDSIPYLVKMDKEEPIHDKTIVQDTEDKVDSMETPKLIADCIDALFKQGRNPTNDNVKLCIEGKCKDDEEYNECMNFLETVNIGGMK